MNKQVVQSAKYWAPNHSVAKMLPRGPYGVNVVGRRYSVSVSVSLCGAAQFTSLWFALFYVHISEPLPISRALKYMVPSAAF